MFKQRALALVIIFVASLVILLKSGFYFSHSTTRKAVLGVQTTQPNSSVNCNYYQASWIQFKRDFMETQYKNYSSSNLADQDLAKYLKQYQQEASLRGCGFEN